MAKGTCKVWLGIVLAVFTTGWLGLEAAFNVYAVALKKTFNFTQTEVEMVSVSGLAGMGASLMEPFVTGRLGHRVGYLFIWTTTSVSALLMWMAVVYRDILSNWSSIICILHFVMSLGQNAGSTRLISISIHNVDPKYTGKLVGLGYAAIAAAKLIYGGLFQLLFVHDLGNFFLAVAAIFAVSVGICSLIHIPRNEKPEEVTSKTALLEKRFDSLESSTGGGDLGAGESKLYVKDRVQKDTEWDKASCNNNETSSDTDDDSTIGDKSRSDPDHSPFVTMISSGYFHLTFWPSVIIYSVMFTYMNNITSIAHSLEILQPVYLVYLLSVTIVSGRLFFGFIFDKFNSNLTGFLLVLSGSLSMCFGITLLVLRLGNIILYFVTFLLGIGVSIGITIPTLLLSSRFGHHTYPYIVGCLYCFTGFFCLFFQIMVGILYDRKLSFDGFCYGSFCFYLSSIILLFVTAVCTVVHFGNFLTNGRPQKPRVCYVSQLLTCSAPRYVYRYHNTAEATCITATVPNQLSPGQWPCVRMSKQMGAIFCRKA